MITFSCFLLFMYKACECIKQYMRYETVTKNSEERQENYPLPQVCISQADISEESLQRFGITARDYRHKGLWTDNRSGLSEEQIYDQLSTKFQDIVERIVLDVLHKDNDNYDQITIFQKFPNGSQFENLSLTSCDYYYSLKCFCINLPSQLKSRAIQKLTVHMNKNAHIAIVAPGNFYGYERKRNEMYTEVGFIYRYQVYHRIAQSLPFGLDPCHQDTEWEEDSCTLRHLNQLIYSQLNCTTPWLLNYARSV